MKVFLCGLLCLLAGSLSLSAQKVKKPIYWTNIADNETLPEIKNRWDRFKQQIMGHFGNQRQVREQPELGEKHQEFIIIPIMQERTNEFWIYLEFFSPSMPEAPIDQRVEQYVRVNRDSIRMEVYYLKNPTKYINEWKKPNPFEKFSKDELIRDETCDLYIVGKEGNPNEYVTIMPEGDALNCRLKNAIGASQYITLWFDLSDKGYKMRFLFYDKDKKLVNQGNIIDFDRLDYRDKDYINYAPNVKPIRETVQW